MKKNGSNSHKKIKKLLDVFLAKPIGLLPLNDSIIFESHSDFCDNSKALFDKMLEHNINQKYKMYWLVEDSDNFKDVNISNVEFVSIKRDTVGQKIKSELKNAILFSRCKYYFYSHRNFARTKPKNGQNFVNLTHGISLKDTTNQQNVDLDKISYITVTSEFAGTLMARTYQGGDSKIKILGYPRNDLLLTNNSQLSLLEDADEINYEKKIVWLPTFRRHKNTVRNDSGTTKNSDLPILNNKEDLQVLNQVLLNEKILLIVKPHPAQDLTFFNDISTSNIKVITNYNLIEKGIELYQLLGESDALITDYSSVYIDYLLTNKPIGFTVDDLKEYGHNLGFLVENPLEYMPGPEIDTIHDMVHFVEQVSAEEDEYEEKRNSIRKVFHKYNDGRSSERVLDFLNLNE